MLVGCRRRGERLLLQVWDTGPGIREAEQQRVFEEFYQVPGSAAPPPGQKKGLGLGLAIVRRLAELMHAPLVLRSVPGRGSGRADGRAAGAALGARPGTVFTLDCRWRAGRRRRRSAVAAQAGAGPDAGRPA